MIRKIVIAVIAVSLLVGASLLLSGGGGGQGGETPGPSATPSPTPTGSIDPLLSDLPRPPADPTTTCGLLKALSQSATDLQAFSQAILDGADREGVARAADAYADATADWDALALRLVSRDPGRLDSSSAGALVEGFKIANSVPQTARYLAEVIRGEETEFSLEFVAAGLARDDAYDVLWAINGYREDVCLAE
jgi:hypothetical protein